MRLVHLVNMLLLIDIHLVAWESVLHFWHNVW
jgi:hypothetical protein